MRYILFFFILIFLMCRAGFSQTLHIIEITDMFSPSQDTIAVGDTVRWINIGGGFHNVVADDNSFTSGDPSTSNWVYDKVFSQPGFQSLLLRYTWCTRGCGNVGSNNS